MKPAYTILVFAVLITLSSINRLCAEDYLFTILPRLDLKDATPKEAIDIIVEAALKAGAGEKGFIGVSIEATRPKVEEKDGPPDPFTDEGSKNKGAFEGIDEYEPTISMNLTNVPLGAALEYVSFFLSHKAWETNSGIVILTTKTTTAHKMIHFTPRLLKAFRLPEKPTAKEVWQVLEQASFKLNSDNEIVVSPDGKWALVKFDAKDAKNLDALLNLIEQGFPWR